MPLPIHTESVRPLTVSCKLRGGKLPASDWLLYPLQIFRHKVSIWRTTVQTFVDRNPPHVCSLVSRALFQQSHGSVSAFSHKSLAAKFQGSVLPSTPSYPGDLGSGIAAPG